MALWQDATDRSRALVAEAVADGGLDRLAAFTWPDGRRPSLRRLVVDMIEEYSRHVGHADLIRESVDGLVGEIRGDARPAGLRPAGDGRLPREGVGRMLHAHATAALASRGFSTATLWVLTGNAPARAFYAAMGWSADGRHSTRSCAEPTCTRPGTSSAWPGSAGPPP